MPMMKTIEERLTRLQSLIGLVPENKGCSKPSKALKGSKVCILIWRQKRVRSQIAEETIVILKPLFCWGKHF